MGVQRHQQLPVGCEVVPSCGAAAFTACSASVRFAVPNLVPYWATTGSTRAATARRRWAIRRRSVSSSPAGTSTMRRRRHDRTAKQTERGEGARPDEHTAERSHAEWEGAKRGAGDARSPTGQQVGSERGENQTARRDRSDHDGDGDRDPQRVDDPRSRRCGIECLSDHDERVCDDEAGGACGR